MFDFHVVVWVVDFSENSAGKLLHLSYDKPNFDGYARNHFWKLFKFSRVWVI